MDKTLEFKATLSRIAAEIRYKPTLQSWDNVKEAAKQLESTYENWKGGEPDDNNLKADHASIGDRLSELQLRNQNIRY